MASPEAVPTTSVVAEITRHPLNPRGEVTEGVDELAASIRELGILEPLVVASRAAFLEARPELAEQIPQTARWVLIAGERRLRAAAVAGLRTVPTVSGDHLMADRVDVEAIVVENVQREALTPSRKPARSKSSPRPDSRSATSPSASAATSRTSPGDCGCCACRPKHSTRSELRNCR